MFLPSGTSLPSTSIAPWQTRTARYGFAIVQPELDSLLHHNIFVAVVLKIDELEAMVNDYIRNGIDMTAKEYAVSEVNLESDMLFRARMFHERLWLQASGLDDLRVGDKGLPEGLKSIRIVRIDGLESNACCGTHVQSLGELFNNVNRTVLPG